VLRVCTLHFYEYRHYNKVIKACTCHVNNLTCYFLFKGIDSNYASYLLSIIGITNTIGRVVCGYVADFPKVNALLMNNICLVVSTVAVAATPFCSSYTAYIVMSIFFGIAICKYSYIYFMCISKFCNNFSFLKNKVSKWVQI
jgi:hypothetical protein